MKQNKLSRRQLLRLSALAGTGAVIAACTPAAPAAPAAEAPAAEAPAAATEAPAAEAPAATEAPAADATATPAPMTAGTLKEVPREDTVIMGWSITSPIGVTNPWATPGYTHQEGNAMMWEPLSYFGIFGDKEIPWLAESTEYNDDFTQLTIKLNQAATWSDGKPVTADDVIWTFDGQMNDEKRNYHASFEQFVKDYSKVDDHTVVVNFKEPSPRFNYEVLTLKFDTGIPIVPKHAFDGVDDVNALAGGLDMPHSGPYDLVSWDTTQKIYDLREDWWAAKAGVAPLPDAKRLIFVNIGGQVGAGMESVAQRVVNNQMDTALDFRDSLIKSTLEQNPKVTSHTGSEAPRGYLDWWPNSLWVNTQLEPFNDPNVRKAISLTINRDQIDEIVYDGAQITNVYPFPLYPGLQKFIDTPAVKALLDQYQPRKFDLDESAKLMEGAGFAKNGDGFWEKDGATVPAVIQGFEGIHGDILPIVVEQLKAGGFDGSINFGPDSYQNMADGKPGFYMFGHGASTQDPHAAFELFHSRYAQPIGTSAGNNRFSRYQNPEFDKIVDGMAPLASDDPKFQELGAQALEIYWKDTIDIPLIQWLHRIPYNQTYWTNWPTRDNVAAGANGAFWAHTGPLVITNLKKAAA